MTDTPNLALPYILPSQAQKHVTHNEAIRALDCLVQLSVESRSLTVAPASPLAGSRYLVATAATGDWTGQSEKIAAFQDGAWTFYEPKEGWLAWVADDHELAIYSAGSWASFTSGGGGGGSAGGDPGDITELDNLDHLGINTTADTTNRLALKSPASLFDNEGAGHQQKINKAAAGDTASVLYQTAYSGRAEMGLTGDDDFHFKVSADGATWHEALKIDRSTGKVSFPSQGGPREVLTANRTYYVRTDGSDSNSGLANTSGGAFLTRQKAYNVIAGNLDLAGFTVTVQIADGTYTTGLLISQPWTGGGAVTFQGNSGTPANVVISATNNHCYAVVIPLPGVLTIKDQKLQTATSGDCIHQAGWGTIQYGNINFGACAGSHVITQAAGKIAAISNYSISGGAAAGHVIATLGGGIVTTGVTITLTGTPAFGVFAQGSSSGGVDASGTSFSGAATGPRYSVGLNGWIYTGGGGASYFPGSTAGSASTGGQYL